MYPNIINDVQILQSNLDGRITIMVWVFPRRIKGGGYPAKGGEGADFNLSNGGKFEKTQWLTIFQGGESCQLTSSALSRKVARMPSAPPTISFPASRAPKAGAARPSAGIQQAPWSRFGEKR